MTIKERVYASRMIEKAERNAAYAKSIGISYQLSSKVEQSTYVVQNRPLHIEKTVDKPFDARN